jgi:hypothetical protein
MIENRSLQHKDLRLGKKRKVIELINCI